ncbi:MAG: hypothetical protein AVDCRST_MAG07-605, partial [uncultured Frankineae bacterium]
EARGAVPRHRRRRLARGGLRPRRHGAGGARQLPRHRADLRGGEPAGEAGAQAAVVPVAAAHPGAVPRRDQRRDVRADGPAHRAAGRRRGGSGGDRLARHQPGDLGRRQRGGPGPRL